MQRYVLALIMICLLAVASILLLRPHPAVELEARLSRIDSDEALSLLNADNGALPTSKNLSLLHARLAAAAGEFATADAAYREVVGIGGATPEVLDEIADIAALSGNLERAVGFKETAQRLAPTRERRAALGYWYRLLRLEEEERQLLQETPADQLTDFERKRLIELYLKKRDIAAYRELLVALVALDGAATTTVRQQLLELNLDEGNFSLALEFAGRWFSEAPKDRVGLETSLRALVGRGAIGQAEALAHQAISTNPGIGAVPAEVFLATGHGGAGRRFQEAWLSSDNALGEEDWQSLNDVAERTGDLRALRHAILRQLPDDDPAPARAFLQFLRYQGPQALLSFRMHLTSGVFEDEPLVGAAWHVLNKRLPTAYDYLLAASEKPLTEWDRSIWMSIASSLEGTPFYREMLAGAPRDTALRGMLIAKSRAEVEVNP